jgi:hypothetical protein
LSQRKVHVVLARHSGPMSTTPHRPRSLRPRGAAKVIAEAPAASADTDAIDEHPDGYYWLGPSAYAEFGPFESRAAALADRDRYSEEAPSEGQSLREAESEIGIADWIDPDTGDPAEGRSPPHLDES